MINEEDTIQMIDLMLQRASDQPFSPHFYLFPLKVEPANTHPPLTDNRCLHARNAQTPLLKFVFFLRDLRDVRIDQDMELAIHVEDDNPFGNTYLGSGKTDSVGSDHRLYHQLTDMPCF